MIQYYDYKTVYLFSEAALHAESGHGAVCVLHVRESLGLLVIYTHIRDDWHDGHSHPLAVSPGPGSSIWTPVSPRTQSASSILRSASARTRRLSSFF